MDETKVINSVSLTIISVFLSSHAIFYTLPQHNGLQLQDQVPS